MRQAEIIGPLAEYRVFVSDELDSLLDALPPQPNGKEAARNNIVREIVETERKQVLINVIGS